MPFPENPSMVMGRFQAAVPSRFQFDKARMVSPRYGSLLNAFSIPKAPSMITPFRISGIGLVTETHLDVGMTFLELHSVRYVWLWRPSWVRSDLFRA